MYITIYFPLLYNIKVDKGICEFIIGSGLLIYTSYIKKEEPKSPGLYIEGNVMLTSDRNHQGRVGSSPVQLRVNSSNVMVSRSLTGTSYKGIGNDSSTSLCSEESELYLWKVVGNTRIPLPLFFLRSHYTTFFNSEVQKLNIDT